MEVKIRLKFVDMTWAYGVASEMDILKERGWQGGRDWKTRVAEGVRWKEFQLLREGERTRTRERERMEENGREREREGEKTRKKKEKDRSIERKTHEIK